MNHLSNALLNITFGVRLQDMNLGGHEIHSMADMESLFQGVMIICCSRGMWFRGTEWTPLKGTEASQNTSKLFF